MTRHVSVEIRHRNVQITWRHIAVLAWFVTVTHWSVDVVLRQPVWPIVTPEGDVIWTARLPRLGSHNGCREPLRPVFSMGTWILLESDLRSVCFCVHWCPNETNTSLSLLPLFMERTSDCLYPKNRIEQLHTWVDSFMWSTRFVFTALVLSFLFLDWIELISVNKSRASGKSHHTNSLSSMCSVLCGG